MVTAGEKRPWWKLSLTQRFPFLEEMPLDEGPTSRPRSGTFTEDNPKILNNTMDEKATEMCVDQSDAPSIQSEQSMPTTSESQQSAVSQSGGSAQPKAANQKSPLKPKTGIPDRRRTVATGSKITAPKETRAQQLRKSLAPSKTGRFYYLTKTGARNIKIGVLSYLIFCLKNI